MTPTPVRVGQMDSPRPAVLAVLPARHLSTWQRVGRATRSFFVVGGVSLVVLNVLLLFAPIPLLHLCTLPVGLLLGPVMGVITLRQRALLGACEVPCPRCGASVAVPANSPGWPARLACVGCGIRVELNLANEP